MRYYECQTAESHLLLPRLDRNNNHDCGISDVYIDVLRANGKVESVVTDSEGRYEISVTLTESITVTFRGYNGTDDSGTTHHFEVEAETTSSIDESELYGTSPFVAFSATGPAIIDFKDVQTSSLNISLLGGSAGVGFISGQKFAVVAADTASCSYANELEVTAGHVTSDMPAMPMTITMDTTSSVPAVGHGSAPYGDWSGDKRVRCASSTDEFIANYFETMGQLEQEADLSVDGSVAVMYTYVSPLCLEMKLRPEKSNVAKLAQSQRGTRNISKENFLLEAPSKMKGDDLYGTQCFNFSDQILTEGDEVSLNFVGFEKYPNPNCEWPVDYNADDNRCSATSDYITSPSHFVFSLEIIDGVSGLSQQSFDDIAETHPYELIAGAPRAFSPFTKEFLVQGSRSATSAAHGSVVLNRHIPVLGVLPEEVPRVYPVSTDPTLIFSVLRDPPGGSSSTTLEEGSAFGFSMTIDGMRAASRSDGSTFSFKGGIRGGGGDLEDSERRRRLTSDVLKLPNITAQLVEQFTNASRSRRRQLTGASSTDTVFEFLAGTCVIHFWC